MFTIGADPEYFGRNDKREVSVIGKVGGTKEEPLATTNGWVQEDNVAAEINIYPANNADEFVAHIKHATEDLAKILSKSKLLISDKCFAVFKKHELKHPNALRSGCDPDFNAWQRGKMNEAPNYSGLMSRSCGGHIHVGFQFENSLQMMEFVRLLDLYLALPAVMVEDARRKELYGKAGCFRQKTYGVEYRTLSNFWCFKEEWIRRVYLGVELAFKSLGTLDITEEVERIVNENDKDSALVMMQQYAIPSF